MASMEIPIPLNGSSRSISSFGMEEKNDHFIYTFPLALLYTDKRLCYPVLQLIEEFTALNEHS
jgi:hypothetical protein